MHHIISEEFAVCLSGRISISLLISCPLPFSLSPALLTPSSSSLSSSPSLIYPPGSFHPSVRPSVWSRLLQLPCPSRTINPSPSARTWPSYSTHVLTHANTHVTNTRLCVHTHSQQSVFSENTNYLIPKFCFPQNRKEKMFLVILNCFFFITFTSVVMKLLRNDSLILSMKLLFSVFNHSIIVFTAICLHR